MTLAQVSDVIFLVLLAFMLRRLGYKLDHRHRPPGLDRPLPAPLEEAGSAEALQTALIYTAILLHGVCYDFLFIAGQLYVDNESTERNRGAAQGFIAFILWGVGAFVGTNIAGQVQGAHVHRPAERVARPRLGRHLAAPAWMAAGGAGDLPDLLPRADRRSRCRSSGDPDEYREPSPP